MKRHVALALASLSAPLALVPAMANDTVASINLGGLELSPSAAVTMESEDLYLSEERIRVRYVYANDTSAAEHLMISFPLPMASARELEEARDTGMYQEWELLDFQTLIDGKPAPLTRHDVPMVGEKSVEARLKQLGFPVLHWRDEGLADRLNALPDDVASALVAEGILIDDADSGGGAVRNLRPGWAVQTHVTRFQTFLPGEKVVVEHSYRPMVGGSASGSLNRDYRDMALNGPDGLGAPYCIDPPFLAAYDRRVYGGKPAGKPDPGLTVVQTWFGYVLKTGANWLGPIKNFRLVVDKGRPDNLVSFCMDGVKKISPTQFEVVKTDFEPTRDLDVFLVEFIVDGEGR